MQIWIFSFRLMENSFFRRIWKEIFRWRGKFTCQLSLWDFYSKWKKMRSLLNENKYNQWMWKGSRVIAKSQNRYHFFGSENFMLSGNISNRTKVLHLRIARTIGQFNSYIYHCPSKPTVSNPINSSQDELYSLHGMIPRCQDLSKLF